MRIKPPSGLFTAVRVGYDVSPDHLHDFACGIRLDGTLSCWGDNTSGRATPPSGAFSHLSVNGLYGCAVAVDGALHCWGATGDKLSPPTSEFTRVVAGPDYACALGRDGLQRAAHERLARQPVAALAAGARIITRSSAR